MIPGESLRFSATHSISFEIAALRRCSKVPFRAWTKFFLIR
jgi:hypothetical protein